MVGWLFGCFLIALRFINPFRVIQRRIKFQTIQVSISVVFVYKKLNVKNSSISNNSV